jgi:hypothetical protein
MRRAGPSARLRLGAFIGRLLKKRLRRSQIFIARDAKTRDQLRRSDTQLETTFYAAPNGADRVYLNVGYKDSAPRELVIRSDRDLAEVFQ